MSSNVSRSCRAKQVSSARKFLGRVLDLLVFLLQFILHGILIAFCHLSKCILAGFNRVQLAQLGLHHQRICDEGWKDAGKERFLRDRFTKTMHKFTHNKQSKRYKQVMLMWNRSKMLGYTIRLTDFPCHVANTLDVFSDASTCQVHQICVPRMATIPM